MSRTPPQVERESFLWIARQPSVVRRALKIALIVGVLLAVINHGDKIIALSLNFEDCARIALTFCVPYSVSTLSSVMAIRERTQALSQGAIPARGSKPSKHD